MTALAAEESRDLQYVDKVGSHGGFLGRMYVGNDRHAEFAPDTAEYSQGLEVAYTGKRIEAAAVGLAIAALEGKRYVEAAAYGGYTPSCLVSHILALNHTRAGKEKEIVAFRQMLEYA